MFNIGDIVVYGTQGICRIDSCESKQIGKTAAEYYVLKPLYNESTAVFVPVANETLTAKMQSVLTRAQAEALIKNAPQIDVINISDEALKREQYKVILSSGDREQLVSLIKTIRLEKEIRRQSNKKLNINDEQTLRKAELLLYNELAFVLGVTPDEVQSTIKF